MNKLKIYLSLCLAIFGVFAFNTKIASAYNELSINVGLIAGTTNVGFSGAYGDSCPVNLNDGYYINQNTTNYCGITGMLFRVSTLGWSIGNGNYLKIYFYGYELRDKEDFHSVQNNGFSASVTVNNQQITLVNVGFNGGLTSQNSAIYEYIFKYEGDSGVIQNLELHPGVALAPNELYRMGGISLYGVSGANADYSSQLSDLIRQNEAIISKLGDSNINDSVIIASSQAQTQAIEDGNDASQNRWEQDKQEQADKQDELEDQSDNLSLSAQNPGNPFASMFNSTGCQSLPTVSSWFNMSEPMQVCSPYPQHIRPIIEFVSSALVVGLLIRLYFKQLNGGYNS